MFDCPPPSRETVTTHRAAQVGLNGYRARHMCCVLLGNTPRFLPLVYGRQNHGAIFELWYLPTIFRAYGFIKTPRFRLHTLQHIQV